MTFLSNAPNQQEAEDNGKFGFGKVAAAVASCWAASYLMNWFSLHGVNFEVDLPGIKVSSEIVKSTLEAGIDGVLVWATPAHFVAFVRDVILGCRGAWGVWRDAATKKLT